MNDRLKKFQQLIEDTALYPMRGNNITYPALGLCGEAGEVAEKVKKIVRDQDGVLTEDNKKAILKELGDVSWYLTAMASELGYTLDDVLDSCETKLRGRMERGTLSGSGDDR